MKAAAPTLFAISLSRRDFKRGETNQAALTHCGVIAGRCALFFDLVYSKGFNSPSINEGRRQKEEVRNSGQ
jgi:hypothetical protein